LVQNFALSMLEHKEKFEEVNESLITERENLYQNMKELQIEVKKSYTNFLSFNLGKKSIPFFHYLQEKDMAIRNIGQHPILKNYLRISLGNIQENKQFLEHLKSFIKK
ncbi:MAG: aminotransferase class I/II-fold pyridoxal phosphate-dependent enzyme, partial [Candidatus Cloacimonadota bacterium]|nr:aminotransferase class I/II-fold pyridoxal phosphate-dependent enzyme [Candidatus Cloacimonadota bacterium]